MLAAEWDDVKHSLRQPYRVTWPLVLLLALIPAYIFIPMLYSGRTLHVPETPLDRIIPLEPAWALIYGSLYVFLIVLPFFVVRQPDHIRNMLFAYLLVWLSAYAVFLAYPTVAPRPERIHENGFASWGLSFLYDADTPYNCLPSIHVGHSFVSALACLRVHRKLGVVCLAVAAVVALSTLFTKQHYVLDVAGGVGLALTGYLLFVRRSERRSVPKLERRLAPVFAIGLLGAIAVGVLAWWTAYQLRHTI